MERVGESNGRGVTAPRYLEIDLCRGRRFWGLVGYMIFYLLVAGALVALLMQFTRSTGLAVGLVVGMVGYMSLMGRWVVQTMERQHGRR